MTGLERQLTEALEKLSEQYEREQRSHSEQVEALRQQGERQTERVEALRRQAERQAEQSRTLRRLVERLSVQVKRLADDSGTGSRTTPFDGRWR